MNRGSRRDFLQREKEVLASRRGRLNQGLTNAEKHFLVVTIGRDRIMDFKFSYSAETIIISEIKRNQQFGLYFC